jgi:translation initiation factor IF-3
MGPRVNERIRVREIRVIDDEGEQLGVMTPREALDIARGRGLDLIEVAPTAQPPVCRIMDYGKFKYEQGKKEREAAKKQRQSEMKGMTLRPGTDDHDLDFKIKNVVKFLADGDKVKVTVRFKSREMSHPEFAHAALSKFVTAAQEAGVGVVERPALMEGRQMIMILAPAGQSAKKNEKPEKSDKPERPERSDKGERPSRDGQGGQGAAQASAPRPAPVPVSDAPVQAEPKAAPAPTPEPAANA